MVIHCPWKSSMWGHDDADDYAGVDDVEHESMAVVIRRPKTEEADEAVVKQRVLWRLARKRSNRPKSPGTSRNKHLHVARNIEPRARVERAQLVPMKRVKFEH